jgi:hypothetical protein
MRSCPAVNPRTSGSLAYPAAPCRTSGRTDSRDGVDSESTSAAWCRAGCPTALVCFCPAVSVGETPLSRPLRTPGSGHWPAFAPRRTSFLSQNPSPTRGPDCHLKLHFQPALAGFLALELVQTHGRANLDRPALLCAGIGPLTRSRFFSLSILTTSRLRTVTRSSPMWPAMRLPFFSRRRSRGWSRGRRSSPGSGACVPRRARRMPLKLWRFMTPAKPLPLLVPTTSTYLTPSRASTVRLLAQSKPAVLSPRRGTRGGAAWERCRPWRRGRSAAWWSCGA